GAYFYTASAYLLITMVDAVACLLRRYQLHPAHLLFILLVDICAHTVLMNASGGLASGIGYLMLVTVAAGSIFFTGQLAVLVAAIASIGIIIESASQLFLGTGRDSLFPAGLLGILLFITALLFQGLNRALRRAEKAANQEAEQAAQLQELNERIISRMLTGVVVVDGSGTIELINQAAAQLLGGNSDTPAFRQRDKLAREHTLNSQLKLWRDTPWRRLPPFTPRLGNTEVQASFKPLDQAGSGRTLIFLEDFRAAAQQAQQLKLAALGRLAGSIAHEIRNPLGAISHASQLLEERFQDDEATARLTGIIGKQVRRMNQIIENVLELSRPHPHDFTRIELGSWLRHYVREYQETIGQPVTIELEIECDDIIVSFDNSHLQQVLGNLLDNAVRHSREHSGEPWAKLHAFRSGIDTLPLLDILDKGPGVAEEDREKLFEPFYTTSSEGSGLGLYIAGQLCAINYATLKYQAREHSQAGCFRISFAHPGKIMDSPNI
ncbi:MAG: ATP-binding protein, partial [Bacteroidales bacterium]|nr:ATP-binding protein [Bacteroidales bacterium]